MDQKEVIAKAILVGAIGGSALGYIVYHFNKRLTSVEETLQEISKFIDHEFLRPN